MFGFFFQEFQERITFFGLYFTYFMGFLGYTPVSSEQSVAGSQALLCYRTGREERAHVAQLEWRLEMWDDHWNNYLHLGKCGINP